jgi:hypothetical protein
MKKTDYSKHTREDLEAVIEKQSLEIVKFKENIKADDKRIDKLEGIILKMEKDKNDWFEIEKNAAAYANVKQFEALKRQMNEYKSLYENTKKSKDEIVAKFQERIENLKEKKHNERGAGRKLRADKENITKLILDNKDKPLREIEKIIMNHGEKVSIMTISKIKKEL